MSTKAIAPLTPSQTGKKTASRPKKDASAKKKMVFEEKPETNEVVKNPSTPKKSQQELDGTDIATPVKVASANKSKVTKGLSFGYSSENRTVTEPEVKAMYKIVNKCTGTLGGNGAGGAIYGELTQASMQKVVNLLTEKAGLNTESAFIDVGAGLGKPNLHVAIDPGVKISVGIEMEYVRWLLSLHNLRHFLDETENIYEKSDKTFHNNVVFMHGDAAEAKSFDPFTHIYMFDIGFPPALFLHLAECVRKSTTAKYVLCYHAPHLMIERYGFSMEFIEKQATSMHGSSEGHTAYLYRCTHLDDVKESKNKTSPVCCDPLFKECVDVITKRGGAGLTEWVGSKQLEDDRMSGNTRPKTRSQSKK